MQRMQEDMLLFLLHSIGWKRDQMYVAFKNRHLSVMFPHVQPHKDDEDVVQEVFLVLLVAFLCCHPQEGSLALTSR